MADQAARLANQHVVAHSVCKVCGGGLTEVYGVVKCARDDEHIGFVERAAVQAQTHRDLTVLDEVAGNYPWLDPRPKLSPEKIRAGSLALYGEEK